MRINKIGGLTAIALTVIYLIGIVMNVTMLDTSSITDGVKLVEFMRDHEVLMYAWITLLYVVFGIILVVLSLAIHEKLKVADVFLSKVATAFGLIWAGLVIASGMVHNVGMGMAIDMLSTSPVEAGQFFKMINAIHIGLGGGNEINGAIWTLVISLIALKHGLFKKWINVLGMVVGIAGLLTIAPPLFDYAVMVFALGQMVWWIGLGVNMIKSE
ncbi:MULTISPECIES: DUF4386 family protein [unclassified Fusibacter]|uniref:DUF4386 family protein n=1 Tax=unclassified Fusibacter TaxID=2624464 RepID=UPI00101228FD|nr:MULTISPECIES: DUF4386 family protein [unclassified Fusibacter]MCK8060921.1 DUF4386 domain-containing protein [Fusibacter sp. A2]NPE23217.1 DUF4386 family protein [Fusibacter sp. A1]RXV59573.1 DUF4386 family protein [Fusibacter sp. A1]